MSGDEELVEIGAGPVATVYGGLYIAMKVYPTALDDRTREAFEREQARLAPLQGTVPILPVDEVVELADGRSALQVERCSLSLAELVAQSGELGPVDVLTIGHAVAVAVAAAHRVGVVHGGLTPHNVLIHPSGAPLVTDFGVVLREAFPPDESHAAEYTAPETLRDGTRNEAADLYGLGGVLFLALTGYAPDPGIVRPVSLPHRDDIPPALATLVVRLLAHHPADRPATAGVVVRQLAEMLANLTEVDEDTAESATAPEETTQDAGPPEPAESPVPVEPAGSSGRPGGRGRLLVGAAVGTAGVAAALLLIPSWTDTPSSAALPPAPPPTAAATTSPQGLTLAEPADQGTYVDLAWNAAPGLTFAVAVAGENEQTRVLIANENRAIRVPVDPARKYCFQVQATDGHRVQESEPKPIRGAACTR